MNEIAKIEPKELTAKDIQKYICPDANEKEVFMFLQIAKSCNLNPFLNQIYLVKYGNQKAQILTSYNVYLQRAERSGKYAGLETQTIGTIKGNDLKGVVKVFRKDWEKPLVHEVYYEEYVAKTKDKKTGEVRVNKFWREKPRTMILKVAISQAMRLAFPVDFEGMPYTSDEINTIDANDLKNGASDNLVEKGETASDLVKSKSESEDAEIVDKPVDGEEAIGDKSPKECLECSACARVISEKVNSYSQEKYGKPLCFDCQKGA